jgi:hypothetical protein
VRHATVFGAGMGRLPGLARRCWEAICWLAAVDHKAGRQATPNNQPCTCVAASHECDFVAPLSPAGGRRQRPAAATNTLRRPACCSADMHSGARSARQGSPAAWLNSLSDAGTRNGADAAHSKRPLHRDVLF